MPAVYVDDVAELPRILVLPGKSARERPVQKIVNAPKFLEGEDFEIRRTFSEIDLTLATPFLPLDHLGVVEYSPGEAKGAPDHPHRGFETVTYMMDSELEHRDSNGGGGLITDGATQWMTPGAGIGSSDMPTEIQLRTVSCNVKKQIPRSRPVIPATKTEDLPECGANEATYDGSAPS
jgi:redox-sensitive bicupin YhaK (pirin superfamily)